MTARQPDRVGPGRPRRTPLTTRAALLGAVVTAVAVLLALPVKTYLGQHDRITALARDQAAQQQRIAALQRQVRRFDDPAYVASQARARLHYQLRGEQDYVVVPPTPSARPSPRPAAVARPGAPGFAVGRSDRPWFSLLWGAAAGTGGR